MENILDRALKRADRAEVFYLESEQTPILFKSDTLHSIDAKQKRGVGLRVVKDGKIGFSSTSDMSRIDDLIEGAVDSANFGQEARFEFPGRRDFPEVNIYDENVVNFSVEDAVKEGGKLIGAVKEKEPDLKIDVHIEKAVSRARILNSQGLDVSFDKTYFTYYVEAFLLADGSFVWISEGKSKCSLCLETEKFVDELLWKTSLAKKPVGAPDRALPVIFMPEALISLLHAFALGVNGKRVQKGSSPLLDRVGEKILSDKVSICDDGLLECGIRSSPVDGEGVPSTKLTLVEEGVLKGYIFDLQTAGLMGVTSTGNGSRGYSSAPVPEIRNFCVGPGASSVKEMFGELKEGIVIYDVLGGGQSNLLAGDFSVNISLGFKVENGEMVGRIKDSMIAGNAYDVFNKVRYVGKEVEEVWGYCTPAFCFDDIRVASKGK